MKKTSLLNKLVSFGICYTLLVCAAPVKAGILVGEFSSKMHEYKKFADSFNTKNIGYLIFIKKDNKIYKTCSGTLIKSGKDIDPKTKKEYVGGWILTSAHCGIGITDKNVLGAKFVTDQGEADVDGFFMHDKYNHEIAYAEGIKEGDYTCKAINEKNLKKPCKNNPQQAIFDIALVRINKDLTIGTTLKPISPPPKEFSLPKNGFIGGFVGYGKQGSGSMSSSELIDGLITLGGIGGNPKTAKERKQTAIKDRLGGRNFLNIINYSATSKSPAGQVLQSDLDDGSTSTNIDLQPDTKLKLEYSPYYGDSGAGVFDASNRLVAIVSGAGYGNKVVGEKFVSFAPTKYGHLTFYTPLAQHAVWINKVIEANKFKMPTGKAYVQTKKKYSTAILPTGSFASIGKLLPNSIMRIFADIIVQPYPEAFNEAILEEIFPSKPVS